MERRVDEGLRSRWFVGWPVAVAMLAVFAFFPTYFGLIPHFVGATSAMHFHVATMLAWLALGIAQPILIRRRHLAAHRALGRLTFVLLPVIALGFAWILRDGQLRHKEPALLLATAFDAGMFFTFAGLGIYHRRRREYHAPYMMLSLLPFLNPTLGRILAPGVGMAFELALLVGLYVQARRSKRVTRPYAVALVVFLAASATTAAVMGIAPALPEELWRLLFVG